MPQKKPKKTKSARRTVTLRFDPAELATIDADRKDINAGGIPVKVGPYCKHAVDRFPLLRRIDANLTNLAKQHGLTPETCISEINQILHGDRPWPLRNA